MGVCLQALSSYISSSGFLACWCSSSTASGCRRLCITFIMITANPSLFGTHPHTPPPTHQHARAHTPHTCTHTQHIRTQTHPLSFTHTLILTHTHTLSLYTHTLSLSHTHTNNHSRTPWLAHVVFVEAPVCSSFNGMSPFEDIL